MLLSFADLLIFSVTTAVVVWCCVVLFSNFKWKKDDSQKFKKYRLDIENLFVRIREDQTVQYGDGGVSDLVHPLYNCRALPVTETRRKKLLRELHALGEQRNDWHDRVPVLDIIDPDLNPRRISEDEPLFQKCHSCDGPVNRIQYLCECGDIFCDGSSCVHGKNDHQSYCAQEIRTVEVKRNLRQCYSWIPSEFVIKPDGSVDICSPIHGLPMVAEYQDLYKSIGLVFQEMIPGFAQIGLIRASQDDTKLWVETSLQVCVKAQSYVLKSGQSYSGRWHVEAETENVVGVGVYYAQIDSGISGGNLKFRNKHSPDETYMEQCEVSYPHGILDIQVSVQQGSAVVFSNILPHRFRRMQNTTGVSDSHPREQTRTFLNFFVIDPNQRIPSTADFSDCTVVNALLSKYAEKYCNSEIPLELLNIITGYMPELFSTLEEAMEFRKKSRTFMTSQKTGFGWIRYGNCGVVEWVRDGNIHPHEMILKHTESDANTLSGF